MFNKIGGKIKTLAEIISIIGILVSAFAGLYYILIGISDKETDLIVLGAIIAIIGPLSSWVGSFLLYGFGQLIENSDIIAKSLSSNHTHEQNNIEKIEEIINNEYFNSNWKRSIENLSNEELQERANSEEWQPEYRVLCMQELENRK